jgi:DNA adenine methylase
MKPILRWIGGKYHIIHKLINYLPSSPIVQYWEPFLGAGALYFSISPKKSFLSDKNEQLMNFYSQLKKHPDKINNYLNNLKKNNSKEYYYWIREKFNKYQGNSIAQAARFLYLNRTCFNGVYRVNSNSCFNVPYGYKRKPSFPTLQDLRLVSKKLKTSSLTTCSFSSILNSEYLNKGDLVYLDPPYPPLSKTAFFNHYTHDRFIFKDQQAVAETAKKLDKLGCKVIITNSDLPEIRELFLGWHIYTLKVTRYVSANGKRYKINELVITNYNPRKVDY